MKFLYPNLVTDIRASEEDGSFPVENLLDHYPKNTWKATSVDATLTVDVSGAGDSISIFNINASVINVAVIPATTGLNNLVLNDDFEDWTTGDPDSWTEGANVTTDEDTGRSGGSSAKLTATNTTDKQMYQTITVVAEKQHRFNFYYKNTAGDFLDYFVYDVSNGADIIVETSLADSTSWSTEQVITFKTPVGCTSVRVGFTPKNNGDICWVDDTSLVVEVENNNYLLKGATTYYELITDTGEDWSQLWASYDTAQASAHTVVLTLTTTDASVAYAGVVEAGLAQDFNNPVGGLTEDLKDFSIVNVFKYGGVYINKRDIVRIFSGSLDVSRDVEFLTFMRTMAKNIGSNPLPVYVVDNLDQKQWTLYGRFTNFPVGTHNSFSHSSISFSIEEVV